MVEYIVSICELPAVLSIGGCNESSVGIIRSITKYKGAVVGGWTMLNKDAATLTSLSNFPTVLGQVGVKRERTRLVEPSKYKY